MKTFTSLLLLSALLLTSAAQAQYCTLPGRVPYSTDQPGITNFKLGTINRSSSNVESMSAVLVVTVDSTVLLVGHTYTVTITHNRDAVSFPTARNNIRVWIDYNNNYSFDDAGETVISADYQNYGVYTGSFTVPATATPGTVRLRATVKMSSDAGHTTPTSCDMPADPLGYHGEMEDYKVKIQSTTAVGVKQVEAPTPVVSVYPNPVTDRLTVSLDGLRSAPLSIQLYDMAGRLVGSLADEQVQSSPSYSFDLNSYVQGSGMYFLKVVSGNTCSYRKIVKVN